MFEAVVIGVSAGGMHALKILLPALPPHFRAPIAVVQHVNEQGGEYLCEYLNNQCALEIREAMDKEAFLAGTVYFAPAGYHLLVEPDHSLSLSVEDKINYCRPAIDPLFESAADAYGSRLVGVVLTGANADGARGLQAIRAQGGCAIIQNPRTAEVRSMPQAALDMVGADHIVDLEQLAPLLQQLCEVDHGLCAND